MIISYKKRQALVDDLFMMKRNMDSLLLRLYLVLIRNSNLMYLLSILGFSADSVVFVCKIHC